jgi:checkpoint serine/threonine-protein kinase
MKTSYNSNRKLHERVLGIVSSSSDSPRGLAMRAKELSDLIIVPKALFVYKTTSCLLLPRALCSMWHLISKLGQSDTSSIMSEITAAFYISRMIRGIELLVGAEIIHADLKLDNWVVAIKTSVEGATAQSLTVTLIDFGRAIDRKSYSEEPRFLFNECSMKSFGKDAKEMVCGDQYTKDVVKGWTHELDLHGLAVSVLYMINPSHDSIQAFLQRHENECKSEHKGQIMKVAVIRGWDKDLWSNFVNDMLRPRRGESMSPTFILSP